MRGRKFYFNFFLTKVPMKTETKHCIKAACYGIVLMCHNIIYVPQAIK